MKKLLCPIILRKKCSPHTHIAGINVIKQLNKLSTLSKPFYNKTKTQNNKLYVRQNLSIKKNRKRKRKRKKKDLNLKHMHQSEYHIIRYTLCII